MQPNNNREISLGTFFFAILAPLISCVLILLRSYFPWLSAQATNAFCAFCYACYLLLMFYVSRNAKKLTWASGMLAESLVALFYSAADRTSSSSWNTPLEFLTGNLDLFFWLVALVVSTLSTLTLGFRTMRWTQDAWEERQKLKREHKLETERQRMDAKKEKRQQELDNKREIREIYLGNRKEEAKESGDVGGWMGLLRKIRHFVMLILIVAAPFVLAVLLRNPAWAERLNLSDLAVPELPDANFVSPMRQYGHYILLFAEYALLLASLFAAAHIGLALMSKVRRRLLGISKTAPQKHTWS